jgi:hypothetical protein
MDHELERLGIFAPSCAFSHRPMAAFSYPTAP